MAVIILHSSARLARVIARLRDGDVLVLGAWRVVLAANPEKPYWLEGCGHLHSIARTKSAAAEIRRLIASHDANSGATS